MDLAKGQASRALLKAAGESIQQELDTRYVDYLEEGEIAVTKAGRLRCRNLLFGVLYSYDKASDKHNDGEDYYVKSSVYDFMRICLETAEEKKVASIAFPAIGSGGLGYPVYTVAEAMFDAVTTYNSNEPVSYLKQVIFVVHQEDDYAWGVFKLRMEHFGKDGSTSDKSSADGSEDEQNQPSGLSSSRKGMTSKSSEKVKQNSVRSKPASPQDHDDGTRSPSVDEQHFTDSYRGQRPGEIDDLSIGMGSQSLNDTDRSDNKQIGDKHTDRARDLSSSSNKMVKDGTVPASKKRISWPQSHPKSVVEWFISDILKKYRKKNFEFNIVDDCMLYDGPDELDSVFRTEFKSARQKLSSDLQRDHLDVSESTVTIHIDREGETDSGVFIEHVQADKIINFYGKQWNDIQKVKSMFQAKLFPNTVTTRRDRQLCTKESPENDLDTPSANDQSKINVCSATSGTENGARQKTFKGMRGKSTVPDFQRQFSWSVDANNLEVFNVENVTVKVYSADILSVPVDCIVNAANSQLNHQGGVAKVIAKAAGRKFIHEGEDYIKRHGPLQCGEACETSAGKLRYHHVIHTVGPCWKPHSQTDIERCECDLRMAIKNSLSHAERLRHSSIAIPAVSSGKFGCPEDFCAVQYALAILEYVGSSRSPLQEIHFVDTNLSMVMVIQKVFRSKIRKGKPPKDYDVKKYVHTSVANTQTRKEKKETKHSKSSKPINPSPASADNDDQWSTTSQQDYGQHYPFCEPAVKQPARDEIFTCFFANNKKLLVYNDNVLTLKKKFDIKACGENVSGSGKGYLAKEFEKEGGIPYQKAKKDNFAKWHGRKPGDVVVCAAGKMKCKFVAHVILPQGQDANDKDKMNSTFKKMFEAAVKHKCQTMALPLLGTGKARLQPDYVTKRLYDSMKEFSTSPAHHRQVLEVHLVNTEPDIMIAIKTIQAVVVETRTGQARPRDRVTKNNRPNSAVDPAHSSRRANNDRSVENNSRPASSAGYVRDNKKVSRKPADSCQTNPYPSNKFSARDEDDSDFSSDNDDQYSHIKSKYKDTRVNETSHTERLVSHKQVDMSTSHTKKGNLLIQEDSENSHREDQSDAENKKTTEHQITEDMSNTTSSDGSEGAATDGSEGAATDGSEGAATEDCVICMDTITDPKTLRCGHKFCTDCIDNQFAYKKACPTCGAVCGIITGDQPEGTMDVHTSRSQSCAGYEGCGRIQITYNFPNGVQQSHHPSPGKHYRGIRRSGFLPDNKRGKQVLEMLRVAFDRKLVFTIGNSRTTGQQGVITWNDIHHKTDPSPNTPFGYPDHTYLDRVVDELKAKGVTEADIPTESSRHGRSTRL